MNEPKKHYTSKIFYIPLFICLFIFFILNIIGISIFATDKIEYENNVSRRLSNERNLDCNCCCCCCCQCNNNCNCDNNSNDKNKTQNEDIPRDSSTDKVPGDNQNQDPHNSDKNEDQNDSDKNQNGSDKDNDNSDKDHKDSDKDNNNSDKNQSDKNPNDSDKNSNDSDKNQNENNPSNGETNKSDKNTENNKDNGKDDKTKNKGNEKDNNKNKNIIRLKNSEVGLSITLFFLSIGFYLSLFCFASKYSLAFVGFCFSFEFVCATFPLILYFSLDIWLITIRINCNISYKLIFGIDAFFNLNFSLIWLNFIQLFILLLIFIFLIFIFFCPFIALCECFDECISFFCCCFFGSCRDCDCCDDIKYFFKALCEKDEDDNNKRKDDEIIKGNIDIKVPEFPIDSERERIPSDNIYLDSGTKKKKKKPDYYPIDGENEMYLQNLLQGQKILIVMTHKEDSCNIERLYQNGNNKTVREAVEYYGITIIAVDNYENAIRELTKKEKGKCPYYACWLMNDREEKENMKDFLQILHSFWKNGGAVVLFSDNTPFILETNEFLSMINAGFIMDGMYEGENFIYGDETGKLNKEAVFNRKEDIYKYGNIQRQKLSHSLIKLYEGVTISSVTKNGKRRLNVGYDDIYPFIPFARDSEGGITSLLKLANKSGEGDLILDGGFTKLFINMEEQGTFRYVRNIAGFTARPEVHLKNHILPRNYRPNYVRKIKKC